MKKVLLFVAVITAVSFVSCKKDRVCSCIADTAGATAQEITYIKSLKKDARENCMSTKQTISGTVVTITCTLK